MNKIQELFAYCEEKGELTKEEQQQIAESIDDVLLELRSQINEEFSTFLNLKVVKGFSYAVKEVEKLNDTRIVGDIRKGTGRVNEFRIVKGQ